MRKKEKREARRHAARLAKFRKWALLVLIFAFIGGGIAAAMVFSGGTSEPLSGEFFLSQGREHKEPGDTPLYEYSTNPPTSGWHFVETLPAGFYDTPRLDGNILHSLEHGAIVLSYKSIISDEDKHILQAFYENNKTKLIIVPRENMDTNFALTAWEYIDRFDVYDEVRVIDFIKDHLNRGPENASI